MEYIMSFSRTNLNEVDPNYTTVPESTYSMRVVKADLIPYIKNDGSDSERISLSLTIFDHPEYSGRRIWETIWEGSFGLRTLRKLMDVTGVAQSDEPMSSWLERLVVEKAEFKALVQDIADLTKDGVPNPRTVKPDGTANKKNTVDWRTIAPVS